MLIYVCSITIEKKQSKQAFTFNITFERLSFEPQQGCSKTSGMLTKCFLCKLCPLYLVFEQTLHDVKLHLDFLETNILCKVHKECAIIVTSSMLTDGRRTQ